MPDNLYLDTIISLVVIYALLGILASVLLEAYNNLIKKRGTFLQQVIVRLLDDPLNYSFGYLIYQHPIINKMRKDGSSYPYYISADSFCNALIDVIGDLAYKLKYDEENKAIPPDKESLGTMAERFERGVNTLNESEFKNLIQNFMDRSRNGEALDIEKFKVEISKWYNDYMDRITGEYQSGNRPKLVVIGFAMAIILNVDSIHVGNVILKDQDLRNSLVASAEKAADSWEENKLLDETIRVEKVVNALSAADTSRSGDSARIDFYNKAFAIIEKAVIQDSADRPDKVTASKVYNLVQSWKLPIGWSPHEVPVSWFYENEEDLATIEKYIDEPKMLGMAHYFGQRNQLTLFNVIRYFLGLIITAVAISFGAPFWFKALTTLVSMRRAGVKPAGSLKK